MPIFSLVSFFLGRILTSVWFQAKFLRWWLLEGASQVIKARNIELIVDRFSQAYTLDVRPEVIRHFSCIVFIADNARGYWIPNSCSNHCADIIHLSHWRDRPSRRPIGRSCCANHYRYANRLQASCAADSNWQKPDLIDPRSITTGQSQCLWYQIWIDFFSCMCNASHLQVSGANFNRLTCLSQNFFYVCGNQYRTKHSDVKSGSPSWVRAV